MIKSMLASATIVMLTAGAAMAQGMPADPTLPTQLAPVTPPPVVSSYSSSKTVKSIDGNGVQTEQSQSYTSGINGVKATNSSQTLAPDGSEISATHEERTAIPSGQSTTTITRTTTTTDQ